MEKSLEVKLERLRRKIRRLDGAIIAFSGGVDSSLLMRVCREELGEKAVAVTTVSDNYPESELSLARRIAKVIGARHITQRNDSEDDSPYSPLQELALKMRIKDILDGSHKDDREAAGRRYLEARKAGVKSPLLESGLTKREIRILSKEFGLPNWNRPSSGKDSPLWKAKRYLLRLGIKDVAVAKRGMSVLIRSDTKGLMKALKELARIRKRMRALGFRDVLFQAS